LHRPVRLEISSELFLRPRLLDGANERITARVFLRNPFCIGNSLFGARHDKLCECGPLSEKRIG